MSETERETQRESTGTTLPHAGTSHYKHNTEREREREREREKNRDGEREEYSIEQPLYQRQRQREQRTGREGKAPV